jgi:predicted  nucleic acid-binding Zn ribbon protein
VSNFVRIDLHDRGIADEEAAWEAVVWLASRWTKNGRLWGGEPLACGNEAGYEVYTTLPEPESLADRHASRWVREALERLPTVGLGPPRTTVLGTNPEVGSADECARPSAYILFTHRVDKVSPLVCGDCFLPAPLYRIPDPRDGGGREDAVLRQLDYQRCDSLWIGSGTGEQFGRREMARLDGSLSEHGRRVCEWVNAGTGVPTYYYPYRAEGGSRQTELRRRCPGCRGRRLLAEPWHIGAFRFRCDTCRLLSNSAFELRDGRSDP